MDNKNILTIKELSYETSSRPIFQGVSFSINTGDKIGLVGNNGIGKTTLLKIINKNIEPTDGQIFNNNSTVGLLPQNISNYLDQKVHNFVEDITGVTEARLSFEKSCESLESNNENALLEYNEAYEKYNKLDVSGFDQNLAKAFGKVGLIDINIDKKIREFSGGQQQKIALAAIIASKQDLVLLDEPTNNLDEQGIISLEKIINDSPAAFLIVSHDRRFLRNTSNRVIELLGVDGVKQYNLGYDEYVQARESERKSEEDKFEQFQTEKKKMQKSAKAAQAKANSAAKSTKKHDNDKLNNNSRKENATIKLGQNAKNIKGKLDKISVVEEPDKIFSLKFNINEESIKKSSGIDVRDLSIKYNEKVIIGPYSFSARIGDRISLVGANGTGKSSILRAINGTCDGEVVGEVRKNNSTKIIYIDQEQSLPLPEGTAFENLRELTELVPKHELIITLLQFGLNKEVINIIPANKLSGGERMKILLAATKLNQAEVLLMDEPTNNLDIPTVEGLSTALKSFKGMMIVISHDREFLDEINITNTIEIK